MKKLNYKDQKQMLLTERASTAAAFDIKYLSEHEQQQIYLMKS